jgi:hypothetical protein
MGNSNINAWRAAEMSFHDAVRAYPYVPPMIILKIDMLRRGIVYTKNAVEHVDPQVYMTNRRYIFNEDTGSTPVSLLLRDGTSVNIGGGEVENAGNIGLQNGRTPYVIDYADGKFAITDEGEILEETDFWRKPEYYNKTTNNGLPMWQVVSARPQKLDISVNNLCHFWDKPGGGCKYCVAGGMYEKTKDIRSTILKADDVRETVAEAIRQEGGFSTIMFTGGSILSGQELFDDEVELYIELICAAGDNFNEGRFPSFLVGSAFSVKQLARIYTKTKLMSYTADIEVLNEECFNWICPGKAEFIGYKTWKERLYRAVDIFGKGNVSTGLVNGVEMAKPKGFASEKEALPAVFEEMDEITSHGVSLAAGVWGIGALSILKNQVNPSLDYYIQVFRESDRLHQKYGIPVYNEDYRRCGSHPNMDLARLW